MKKFIILIVVAILALSTACSSEQEAQLSLLRSNMTSESIPLTVEYVSENSWYCLNSDSEVVDA